MAEYHYFVAHDFSKQQMDDLREAVERAFKGTGLRAYYADIEVRSASHILDKIKDMILSTKFGIYDISNDLKPNVFIELGFAMGANRPFYLVCKKGSKIPADIAGIDRLEYESYKELSELLMTRIVSEINRPRIQITRPKLSRNNTWQSPNIKDWLANPIDKGGGKNDFMFEIEGSVFPIPLKGKIDLWIFKGKMWPQIGGDVSEKDGSWKGKVFLKVETNMQAIDVGVDLFAQDSDTPICSEIYSIK